MLERRTDNIINGICDLGYTTQGLINGINTNILTSSNALQSQLAECCCTTQRAIDSVNFNNAQNTCTITNAINDSYRALHDEIVANRIEDKNAQNSSSTK